MGIRGNSWGALCWAIAFLATPCAWAAPPGWIATQVKPEVLRRAVQDREVMPSARVEELAETPGSGARLSYRYSVLVLVRASVERSRKALTDYPLYAKLVPFVRRSDYDPHTRKLELEGGIFGWTMRSTLQFREDPQGEVHFEIVQGAFHGMTGRAVFESLGEKGTLVFLSGGSLARRLPPRFILERGAEIVFGVAGRRMRSYIEESQGIATPSAGGGSHDPETPKPRRSLPQSGF